MTTRLGLPLLVWLTICLHIAALYAIAGADPRSVVRIVGTTTAGEQYVGSGAYVGDHTILTCAHVVRGSRSMVVLDQRNRRYYAASYKYDTIYDVGFIRLTSDPGLTPFALASNDPSPGETVTAYGFGSTGVFRAFSGHVQVNKLAPQANASPDERIFTSRTPAMPGDSGGPVCNVRGEIVGPLSATDGRTETLYTNNARTCEAYSVFLAQGKTANTQATPPWL